MSNLPETALRNKPMGKQAMVLVPASLVKARRIRGKRGERVWYFEGLPEASLYEDDHGRVVAAHFRLPIDVPAAPRMNARSSSYGSRNLSYWRWRQCVLSGIEFAMSRAGWPLPLPVRVDLKVGKIGHQYRFSGESIFDKILVSDRGEKRRRDSPAQKVKPLWISARIRTRLTGDWDNRAKSLMDLGNGFLWTDDSRSCGGSFVVMPARENRAYSEVFIHYLSNEQREGLYSSITWGGLDFDVSRFKLLPTLEIPLSRMDSSSHSIMQPEEIDPQEEEIP